MLISIHALLAASDSLLCRILFRLEGYFYPCSPCGERLSLDVLAVSALPISIHALLAESDRSPWYSLSFSQDFYPCSPCGERRSSFSSISAIYQFLSMLSLRRATRAVFRLDRHGVDFYPCSPCGERPYAPGWHSSSWNFYPCSPCGERLAAVVYALDVVLCLSMLSWRRATNSCTQALPEKSISIHALLAESDQQHLLDKTHRQISIHALLAESDGAS